jgi:hypothetical protein
MQLILWEFHPNFLTIMLFVREMKGREREREREREKEREGGRERERERERDVQSFAIKCNRMLATT